MRVAVFAEGRSDLAVLTNLLKGKLNIDRSEMRYELPEYNYDQTDLAVMPPEQHSSWTIVKSVCEEKTKISKFLDGIDDNRFVVIQIDTAERNLAGYDVFLPEKVKGDEKRYCNELRPAIINKINEWLDNSYSDKIAYAVGTEETEAWVMTIYSKDKKDTSHINKPKEAFFKHLKNQGKHKNILKEQDVFKKYEKLSNPFRKNKNLNSFADKNKSLKLFLDSLDDFQI